MVEIEEEEEEEEEKGDNMAESWTGWLRTL